MGDQQFDNLPVAACWRDTVVLVLLKGTFVYAQGMNQIELTMHMCFIQWTYHFFAGLNGILPCLPHPVPKCP